MCFVPDLVSLVKRTLGVSTSGSSIVSSFCASAAVLFAFVRISVSSWRCSVAVGGRLPASVPCSGALMVLVRSSSAAHIRSSFVAIGMALFFGNHETVSTMRVLPVDGMCAV